MEAPSPDVEYPARVIFQESQMRTPRMCHDFDDIRLCEGRDRGVSATGTLSSLSASPFLPAGIDHVGLVQGRPEREPPVHGRSEFVHDSTVPAKLHQDLEEDVERVWQ